MCSVRFASVALKAGGCLDLWIPCVTRPAGVSLWYNLVCGRGGRCHGASVECATVEQGNDPESDW